ncbi:MAG: putative 3-hydroxyacyl-CoA dehydrogenase [Alphaproteobacteria bacterium ADurb.BinA280]|jgi:3-hydroxyacyl-CoA dehydrogenase|nr:3-hydroxyacyl-CoA dehydrogenase/enoyl-CoA hydratase family protein [Xanthomonadales bacterium]OPZ13507.1 MAG: putative 3-hydroxyacyl-CoA dehydrogenase [Alphaproteobacteria bacterium ADurb.BinA280]
MSTTLRIRKVAVLGAGVMGAQIAAHLVNANVDTVLFDLPSKEGDPNGIANKAISNLAKLSPAPLALTARAAALTPANYDQHLDLLRDCDLIIEAIAERIDWKKDLYAKIAPHVAAHAILATNTSGLSVNVLAEVLPAELHHRFCGVHFFNPPRYMHLAELIPCAHTDAVVLDGLEGFLTTTLGKGVVRTKDTPNFIANRVGTFAMISTFHHTARLGLGLDIVDALTGAAIGRPKSGTYRLGDVVGLDTLGHVIRTLTTYLPSDPWHPHYQIPEALARLVEKGALGQKTGAGFYRKQGKDILVLDITAGDYRPSGQQPSDEVTAILKIREAGERLAKLRDSTDPQAQFLWSIQRDLFHYAAVHLADIADSAREVDFAMRWGYGWKQGPFESWQAAGWQQVAGWIKADIDAGKAMSSAPLPDWVFDGRSSVHSDAGSYSASSGMISARSSHPVYTRQLFPDALLGESARTGTTLFENAGVRLWHAGDDIAVVSFLTKGNTVSDAVLDGLQESISRAERDFAGLVIWQTTEPFSYGADLKGMAGFVQSGNVAALESMIANFQVTSQRIKYSLVPVVAAVRGMALGGGCEFQMHTARTVAALESYIGLVEAGVGLLPAGGGLKELAVRAGQAAGVGGDVFAQLKKSFEITAMGKTSTSALEAKEMGLLRQDDVVVFNAFELLHVAKAQVRGMAESGYRPALPLRQVPVAGDIGIATFKSQLVNMLSGQFISEHDMEVSTRIATVLCGGEIDRGSLVSEDWLLKLEREHFFALAQMPKTQERIAHTLTTGKPLRN